MITGQRPFSGQTPMDIVISLSEREPSSLKLYVPNVPQEFERIVRKMLAKKPDDRYQSARDLAIDLKNLRRELDLSIELKRSAPRERSSASSSETAKEFAASTMTTSLLRFDKKHFLKLAKNPRLTAGVSVAMIAVIMVYLFWPRPTVGSLIKVDSLVALPCHVYGSDEMSFLADAVPSNLSTLLGQIEGLETKIPPSSLEFEQVKGDLDKIADAYNVNTFLKTSITVDSDRLTLNAQLVEAKSRKLLWGKEFEGQRNDYLGMVRRAAAAIKETIRSNAPALQSPMGLSASSETELMFQQGKYFSNRYNNRHQAADFDAAFAAFKRALELDPRLANAAMEISSLYLMKIEAGEPASEIIPQISNWSREALRINPKCATALVIEGTMLEIQSPQPSFRKMIAYALRAAQLDSTDSRIATALDAALTYGGSLSLATEASGEAMRLDPLYIYTYMNVAWNLHSLGRTQEGLVQINELLDIEPDSPVGIYQKVVMLASIGDLEDAGRLLRRLETMKDLILVEQYLIAQYNVAIETGDLSIANLALERILAIAKDTKTTSYVLFNLMSNLVPVLVRHDQLEPAFTILEKCSERGVIPADMIILNPNFEAVRSDRRFQALTAKAKAQLDELLQILQEAKPKGELPMYLEMPLAELIQKLQASEQSIPASGM
jgi:tetratricopeptide (TPR) repeat protein